MCQLPPLEIKMKYKIIVALCFLLSSTASAAFGQVITTTPLEGDVVVGRQYVIGVDATFEGETADLLIDINGELDYNLFENNTKICFTPTAPGEIKIRIVSIWWVAKKATQRVVKLHVKSGGGANPPPIDDDEPGEPDTPVSKFKELTKQVSTLADKLDDPFGRESLMQIYAQLSDAVKNKSKVTIEYFGKGYEYDFSVDEFMGSNATLAVSRALAHAKSKNNVTDRADWSTLFLVPLKDLANSFDNDDRVVFSKFLAAVAAGL